MAEICRTSKTRMCAQLKIGQDQDASRPMAVGGKARAVRSA